MNHPAAMMLAAMLIYLSGETRAQQYDVGKREFETSCVSCHGAKGKGDGPRAKTLERRAPDLTGLARRHNGNFPFAYVEETIDGRRHIAAHGLREMPIWGDVYDRKAKRKYSDAEEADFQARRRVLALVDYLHRIQDK